MITDTPTNIWNPCLLSDSYKITHWKQYPKGTTKVYSYLESRGGRFPETVFFGLQGMLLNYFVGRRIHFNDVGEAAEICSLHFSGQDVFNLEGWEHIVRDHDGRYPVSIRCAREGTPLPTHNVMVTVENTCPRCFWITNFIETLLVQLWYPITVATQSREIRRVILQYLQKHGNTAGSEFKLHDFGFRGVSSVESAAIGGTAHLASGFKGTDTMIALQYARKFYAENCAGFSIPASEHSTITSWGKEGELDAYLNMLTAYPKGLVACVSDSFDIYNACRELWGKELKNLITSRDGVLVVRPDSGNPSEVVLKVLNILGEAFGITHNERGYKLLHPKVRVIQGDGVNQDSISEILRTLDQYDWSGENIAFGMGGALLQKLDRDTNRHAFKCSYVAGNDVGEWSREVYKDPVTDPGKGSKRGRLKLVARGGALKTEPEWADGEDQMVEVFRDGQMLTLTSLENVRERCRLQ